jgi:hypothetical protein
LSTCAAWRQRDATAPYCTDCAKFYLPPPTGVSGWWGRDALDPVRVTRASSLQSAKQAMRPGESFTLNHRDVDYKAGLVLRQFGLGAAGLGDAPCCPLLVRQGSACD